MLSQNQSKAWQVNFGCMARRRERGNLVEMTTRPQLSKRLQISNMNDIAEIFFEHRREKNGREKNTIIGKVQVESKVEESQKLLNVMFAPCL